MRSPATPPLPLTCDRNLLLDSVQLVDDTGDTPPPRTAPGAHASAAVTDPPPQPGPVDQSDILWTGDAEKAGTTGSRAALAGQQRMGRVQLRGPLALQPGHQPGGPGRAGLPDRGP